MQRTPIFDLLLPPRYTIESNVVKADENVFELDLVDAAYAITRDRLIRVSSS
jgi:hypothetical protein